MNSRKLFQQAIGFTLVVFLLVGCGGALVEPIPTPTPTLTPTLTPTPIVTGIEGRVYFAGTDLSIPDVSIQLNNPKISGGPYPQNPDLTIAKTTTDSQGYYSFLDILPGTYVISLTLATDTRVSSIDITDNEYLSYFEGTSSDGSTILYLVEPVLTVSQGEMVVEDFIVHE